MRRGRYGDGTIDERAPDVWRLRYRAGAKRITQTFRGTKRDAQKALRALLRSADVGEHVSPDRITVGAWIDQWISIGAPARKKRQTSRRSLQRYEELLRRVKSALGDRALQALEAASIENLYSKLEDKIAARTLYQMHSVLNSCLASAMRKGLLAINPMARVERVPTAGESDHGIALDEAQVRRLLEGFRRHPLFLLVLMALRTGARRNELLALMWDDLDIKAKTLRIERTLERTRGSARTKAPKTWRGVRVISIDDELLALLLALREQHLRIAAGVPDGATVDLALVRLPEGALIFPGVPKPGEDFSFTTFRHPASVTNIFAKHARRLGFKGLRFHDLRGTAITLMLNRRLPPHVVAKRHGHDVATMMRAYAKHLPQDDAEAAAVIAEFSKGVL